MTTWRPSAVLRLHGLSRHHSQPPLLTAKPDLPSQSSKIAKNQHQIYRYFRFFFFGVRRIFLPRDETKQPEDPSVSPWSNRKNQSSEVHPWRRTMLNTRSVESRVVVGRWVGLFLCCCCCCCGGFLKRKRWIAGSVSFGVKRWWVKRICEGCPSLSALNRLQ